jgi:Protein of unknown function (DUF3433)
VNVSISSSNTILSIDETAFDLQKRPMDSTFIDSNDFENSFINETGTNHLQYAHELPTGNMPTFQGPLLALAAKYNLSIDSVMGAGDLMQQAQVVKQRFFGEVLLSVMSKLEGKSTEKMPVSVSLSHTRLIANFGIAISLSILLLILAIALISLLYLTRLVRRPLQLKHDPSTATSAALAIQGTETSHYFEGLDRAQITQIETVLNSHTFFMRDGKLLRADDTEVKTPALTQPSTTNKRRSNKWQFLSRLRPGKAGGENEDWRPQSLHRWMGALLILFLAFIIAILIAMYSISRGTGLHDLALVYQGDIRIGNHSMISLAPYSIIPTLIGVLVKLWWSTIDDTFRRLSPFISMLRRPQKLSDGAALSYVTSPILWITAVAFKRGHWLLVVVTFGAFTTEVLQVTLSALWTRSIGPLTHNIALRQNFEIRTTGHIFPGFISTSEIGYDEAYPGVTAYLYGGKGYQTSWIFSALAQLAYNSTPPAWSKDGWGFPPVDLSSVTQSLVASQNSSLTDGISVSLGSASNATFTSPALTGRIQCTPINNSSRWVVRRDLTNTTQWNITANPTDLLTGYELTSSVRIKAFQNSTSQSPPASVAIGQWLHYGYTSDNGNLIYEPQAHSNFTILWINASYPILYFDNNAVEAGDTGQLVRQSHFIFADMPQVQALNCVPIFEITNANVTVGVYDGTVMHYDLLDNPRNATEAWNDAFGIHYSNETAYIDHSPGNINYNNTVR